jgi:hypothetical protein
MRRRHLVALPGVLLVPSLQAEHGWKPYEGQPPLYVEGEVATLIWADPHPHLELVQRVGARIPPDLRQRKLAPHRAADMEALLERAVLPRADDRIWRVDLPTLARLSIWGVKRPKRGEVLGVIGFAGPPVTGSPTLRSEILFVGDRGYPLQADPV